MNVKIMTGVVELSDARIMLRLPSLWIETSRIANATPTSKWHSRPKIILGLQTFGPQLMWCSHNHEYILVEYRCRTSWSECVRGTRVACGVVVCYECGRGTNRAMKREARLRREQFNAPLFIFCTDMRRFNDGDTFWEKRRQTISSLCERHRVYFHKPG
jgi:hypothetical protein